MLAQALVVVDVFVLFKQLTIGGGTHDIRRCYSSFVDSRHPSLVLGNFQRRTPTVAMSEVAISI